MLQGADKTWNYDGPWIVYVPYETAKPIMARLRDREFIGRVLSMVSVTQPSVDKEIYSSDKKPSGR